MEKIRETNKNIAEDAPIVQRNIIRAIFKAAKIVDEDIRWKRCRLDRDTLTRLLRKLGNVPQSIIDDMAENLGLSVIRRDPMTLRFHGLERKFDRTAVAEGAGALGLRFLPTRQAATRCAFEAAREIAYFGFGKDLFFPCPIQQIAHALNLGHSPLHGVILRDLRDDFTQQKTAFDMLKADKYFDDNVCDEESLLRFQTTLRNTPMSPAFIEKASEFFDRRATVGIRDTLRWMLGARHPWFDWTRAQFLIQSAFKSHGFDNFNTPQITYYAYDPDVDEIDIQIAHEHNAIVIRSFADKLKAALLNHSIELPTEVLENLAHTILDIHHDYPDFDLEAQGAFAPQKQFDFMEHSINNTVHQELLGQDSKHKHNVNIRAHFNASDTTSILKNYLHSDEIDTFFDIVDDALQQYDAIEDEALKYKRIPCVVFLLQALGSPAPNHDERLLDTFDLSQMTQLEHASYMRSFPEISEKLVVFFALTLRHLIDTEHAPNLRPRNLPRDFIVLGLWGTRTPNIHVNLYVDKNLHINDYAKKLTRCEIKFTGTDQVETHPLKSIRDQSKILRLAFAHFAPLIEPSILRNLGTFTMAMEEFRGAGHTPNIDIGNLTYYAIDMIHEMARCGIRRTLSDVLAVLEYVIDNAHDKATSKNVKSPKNN